ncbi:Type II secretion system protein N [compost metagenome]
MAELKQGSEAVQVQGKLELQANRQYLFQGTLKPGPELPDQMKQGLPFLGQPDGQGRFPLRYQGRI